MITQAERFTLRGVVHLVLVALAVFMLLPFIWTASTSVKPVSEVFHRPPILISSQATLDGFRNVLDRGADRSFLNTLILATASTFTSLFFCTLGGYAFAKFAFPGRRFLFAFLLATMLVPPAVTIIPKYKIIVEIGWIDSFLAIIVPNAATAFGIFFMRQYIMRFPDELLDAARIDGCSEFGVYRRVVVPAISPGIVSLGLIFFMATWNNYLEPLIYLKSPTKFTLTQLMMSFQSPNGESPFRDIMAVGVISIIPLIILFFVFQRRIVEGIAAGSLKE
jgi:ABC-type glycerol-3-phosphate transport system permease component